MEEINDIAFKKHISSSLRMSFEDALKNWDDITKDWDEIKILQGEEK